VPPFWKNPNTIPLLGLSAFGVVTLLSLLTLRRHRIAIERFFDAEAMAVRRNRELEVAKVELMHSQKMQALGTLAAGIAHDFNNLLSVIRMSNKLIGREVKDSDEVQEHVADIEQAVLQGKNVVGSMLGYARAEDFAGDSTNVSEAVEETVSLLSREFLSGLALALELDREAPSVVIGRGRLEQILLNLIVNASEAMQGQGKLRITVHARTTLPERHYLLRPAEANRYVEMSVIDSGPGISPAVRARLFEPFFTTKRSGGKPGTGLGLSLVYSIAQQDSLGLSMESVPGKGASFTLVIPAESQPSPVRQTHGARTPNPP
jgi:signal transduction histidine kinase